MDGALMRNMCIYYMRIHKLSHLNCGKVIFQRQNCIQAALFTRPYSASVPATCVRQKCLPTYIPRRCYRATQALRKEEDPFMFKPPKKQPGQSSPHLDMANKSKELDKLIASKQRQRSMRIAQYGMLGVGIVGCVLFYSYLSKRLKQKEMELIKTNEKALETQVAAIGGDWELVDHNGKTVTNADFKGHWCILYFGFTHCPDICPDEIEKILEVKELLGRDKHMPKLVTLFVTVDPERDTPQIIKEYLEEFSPELIGLTGSWEQLKVILKHFKVYYSKGPTDEDGDYIVDHSVITFLMNPDGVYTGHFAKSKTNVEIAESIRNHIARYNKQLRS